MIDRPPLCVTPEARVAAVTTVLRELDGLPATDANEATATAQAIRIVLPVTVLATRERDAAVANAVVGPMPPMTPKRRRPAHRRVEH